MSMSQMSRQGSGSLTGRPSRVANTFSTKRSTPTIKLYRNTYQIRAGNPLIGKVNNPEESRKNAEKKHSEGMWASPDNKNPLEKQTAFRAGSGEAEHAEEDIGEGVKKAVNKAKEAVSDVADKISGKDH